MAERGLSSHHLLMSLFGYAVVCDDYFCDSLEVICDVLELEEAVAGATFMAAGSSAPELATSLVTVFTTKDSTGLGTILGSAVFNLVMIICLSGLFGAGPNGKVKHSVYGKRDKSESEKTRLAALVSRHAALPRLTAATDCRRRAIPCLLAVPSSRRMIHPIGCHTVGLH